MDIKKLTDHINSLSSEEQHVLLKNSALAVNNECKRKNKALKRELETSSHCSRKLRTTLYANSLKTTIAYNEAVEMLKLVVKVVL